jgi:BirA family transcriptional regulator, biotin operon repressor / biotin---[acetyl-CoA-carboxylase] ligase
MIEALRELHDLLARTPQTGEQLAVHFSMTRSAVHKRIEQLRGLGVQINAQPGHGYQLPQPIEWLDAEAIRSKLSAQSAALLNGLEISLQTDSTNAQALRNAAPDHALDVYCAELQTAGRGRRGREWLSALGGGLLFSVSMRVEGGVQRLQGLSLAVGAVIAEALSELGVSEVGLKWPNDIQVRDRKLGGILIELDGDASGPLHAVIGIGLNWAIPQNMREKIPQPVTDIQTFLPEVSRNAALAHVLDKLLPLLSGFEQQGFSAWQKTFEKYDALKERAVRIEQGKQVDEGIAIGIDTDGALRVLIDGKEKRYHGGEVTVRSVLAR